MILFCTHPDRDVSYPARWGTGSARCRRCGRTWALRNGKRVRWWHR